MSEKVLKRTMFETSKVLEYFTEREFSVSGHNTWSFSLPRRGVRRLIDKLFRWPHGIWRWWWHWRHTTWRTTGTEPMARLGVCRHTGARKS